MNLLNKVANLMLDEFQLNEVNKLCEKYNRTFSDVVRIENNFKPGSFKAQVHTARSGKQTYNFHFVTSQM